MEFGVFRIKFGDWKFGKLNFHIKRKKWRLKMKMWVAQAWKRVGRYLSGRNSERNNK